MSTPAQIVSEKLLAVMSQNGQLPWAQTWQLKGHVSYSTGKAYRGFNQMATSLGAVVHKYKSRVWVSQAQLHSAGGWTRKGEHFTAVIYPIFNQETLEDGTEITHIKGIRYHNVCNTDQIAHMGDLDVAKIAKLNKEGEDTKPIHIQELIARHNPHIEYGDPSYAPSLDTIRIPRVGEFTDDGEYAMTLCHELAHWTGHGSRLDRDLSGQFGSGSYSYEELIAEIAAATICSTLGITWNKENSAAYVQSWLKKLQANPEWLYKAAQAAQKAADYLLGDS